MSNTVNNAFQTRLHGLLRFVFILLLPLASSPTTALDLSLRASVDSGSGSLGSDMLEAIGNTFSNLGSLSASSLGSSGPGVPFLGEVEAGLLLSIDKRLGISAGLGYGTRGAAVIGYDAKDNGMATALLILPLAEIRIGLVVSVPIEKDTLVAEAGLSGGLIAAPPTLEEWIAGVHSSIAFPQLAGTAALGGAYGGVAWEHPLGPGAIDLGLSGDLGLTGLALDSASSASVLRLPWRLMAHVGYRVKLGRSAQ